MRKYKKMQKVMALALTLFMVIGMLPSMVLSTNAATQQSSLTVSNKVADPETLHNWQAYYGDNSILPDGSRGTSTWKAGGVWTDKSVFASDADITAAGLPTSLEDQNAFLVSLSALASNKEIVGQSSAPTDTMLVLDLSQSMDNSQSVSGMISAANRTIDTLLSMNVNNRVGVVLYSGNSQQGSSGKNTATVILPLDHYTTASVSGGMPQYLTVSGDSNDTSVSIAMGTRDSNNKRPSGSKTTSGGTYIQNGLYQAYEEFAGMTDKGMVQSGVQQGVQRIPILVLMSDGAPTAATTNYYNVQTSNVGDGTSTTNQITFLTQLTAAWVKGKIGAHYNNTAAKFYTLGLGTANSAQATAVLNPSGSGNTLISYWNDFNDGTNDGDTVTISLGNNQSRRLTYQAMAETVGRNYVDRYWAASNTSDMIKAFQQIVDEIGLQSAYTATLVQSGEADLDGYITVQDELGSMMQVKDIKGILLGNTLFTGEEFAKSMNAGELGGNVNNATAYGNEFIRTVKERIGIETSAAQQLVNAAYMDEQLYYNAVTGAYSNYIGWYGDENNNYLGFWDKDTGITATGAPEGSKYINRSYLYLGEAHSSDMMHVIVMVRTEIATGHQTMQFKVPASLIPMITYKVELEGNSLENAKNITLDVTEKDPIRLLYEVGLPDDVNEVNLEQKIAEYLAKDGSNHIHQNADGSYTFYANDWGAHEGVAPDISELTDAQKQALTERVAESHFVPNTANERFYVLEDSVVYDSAHNALTSLPVAGGEYYFARTIVNVTGANGAAKAVTQYEKLSAATVANSANFDIVNGVCVVKAGTVRQTLSGLELEKTSNDTGTIGYSDSLWVYVPGSDADDYNIYSFLGNNGKLTVKPASGIQVTKNVTELADGASAEEKFTITVTLSQVENGAVVTDANGNPLPAGTWETADNRVFTLHLADGETVYITGLTAGTTYTVDEADLKSYTDTYIYENTNRVVVIGEIHQITVVNDPVKPGTLYITKEVEHAVEGEPFPADYEFSFEITFVDAQGNPIVNKEFDIVNNHDGELKRSTDTNGVMRGVLCHGETAHILGIPAGTTVTVTEVDLPADGNYTLKGYSSHNQSGETFDDDGIVVIQSQQNATVVVTNTYAPKATSVDLDIAGTKDFDAEGNQSILPAGSYTFKVQQWNGNEWTDIADKSAKVEYAAQEDGVKTFTIENVLENITFDQAGTYTFQVREVIGNVPNVTYDRTLYTFTVAVSDVDGQLVATITDLNDKEITDGSYEVIFTNTFHTAPVSIDIFKKLDDKSGNPLTSKAGFEFVAVQTNENWEPLTGDDASSLTVYSDGIGEARVSATYKQEGHYYYILSESDGGKPGWIYSQEEYKIEVVVTKDATTGDLSATLIINGKDQESDDADLTFTNTYDPKDATVPVDVEALVTKKLEGRPLVAGEFTFAIFGDGQVQFDTEGNPIGAIAVATNDAAGNVYFDNNSTDNVSGKLTFAQVGVYHYDVVELAGSLGGVTYDSTVYDLVIEVTDNGNGELQASYYFEDSTETTVVFENTYTAEPTEVVIEGLKTIQVNSGLKELTAGMFTFGLYDVQGKLVTQTVNLANGSFVFDSIEYTLADAGKTFTYTVKEIAPDGTTDGSYSKNGLSYSGLSFTVTVQVVDNGNGTLSAEVTGNGADKIHFVNTYNSTYAYVSLSGLKTLSGRNLTDGEFHFAIYSSDETFTQHTLITNTITNDADGELAFSLGSLDMGYHYFVLKEVIPEERAAGISYDASEYYVTVQVSDGGNGQMVASTTVYHSGDLNTPNPDVVFKNLYRPNDGSVVIEGEKNYIGGKALEAGDFTFGLFQNDTEKLAEASVAADGTFAFDAMTFTADDIGAHTYTVREMIPVGATANADGTYTLGNITYDPTEYTVVVTVSDDNKDGELEISKTINDGALTEIVFTNTFTPDPIDHELKAKKIYEKGLKGDDFAFQLISADDKTDVNQTKTNAANGDVIFDKITFTDAGVYKFTVKEKTDSIWNFIRPSAAEYEVTVTVVNENGVLRVSAVNAVNTKNTGEGNLEFVNTYLYEGEDDVIISGTKNLIGDRTTVNAGDFEFGLYDAEGKLIESVKNDVDGKFTFSALIYDQDDAPMNGQAQFVYTVMEIAGDNARYTYDETVYTVTVTVKDNDEGGVEASYVITKDGETAELSFTNTYTNPAPVTYAPAAKKSYNKAMAGGEFQFTLEGEGYEEQTKTNDADGNVVFDDLSFPEAGEYTFTVKELDKALGFITYSKAEHKIVVKVIDTKGVLSIESVTVNGDTAGTVEFVNVYNLNGEDEIVLSGTKTLTGDRTTVNAGEFEFGLYDAEGKLIESVKNDAAGKFTFSALKYDESDVAIDGETVLTCTVKEIAGDNARYTYDETVYTVTVTVKDNDEGGVEASYVITKDGETAELSFTNTYTSPAPVTYAPAAKKSYNKAMAGGEFQFTLEGEGYEKQTKTNDADGNVVFDALSFPEAGEYTFTVKELDKALGFITYSKAEHKIVVKVIDTKGVLSIESVTVNGDTAGTVEFVNVYNLDGEDEIVLSGTKTLTGDRTTVNAGEFEFGLYDAEGKLIESVKNDAAGKFTFSALKYDESDVAIDGETVLTYTVKEIAGDNARYTYDKTVYTVTVTIKDNDEGGIAVSHTITADGKDAQIAFTNTYTNPAPVTYAPAAKKSYNKAMAGGEFQFTLEGEGYEKQTKTNDADGNVVFDALNFPEAGEYTFTVKELDKALGFITYSKAEHKIVVKVIDTKGVLSIESVTVNGDTAGTVEFVNVYNLNGEDEIVLSGTKTLTGDRTTVNAGEFEFGLYDAEGKLIESVKNDAAGKFTFSALKYDESDVAIDGETVLTYTVKEIAGAENVGITYDKTVYTVTVTVKDDNEGGIAVSHTITADGKAAEIAFTNTYTISGTGELKLTGTKELTGGKPLADGEFTFGLYDAETKQLVATAENKDGAFQLVKQYTAADLGKYTYLVAEILPEGAKDNGNGTQSCENITYDPTVYTVNVEVTDNGKGGINVTYALVDAEAIAFENVYTPDPAVITIYVQKILDNKTEKDVSLADFEFEIALGDKTYTAVSDAAGKTGFTVTFDQDDIGKDYTFKIREKNTGIKGMTYDKNVYTITVQVLQNEDGALMTKMNGHMSESVEVTFTNTYENLVTPPMGDNCNLILPIVLMLLSVLGVVGVISLRKKKAA